MTKEEALKILRKDLLSNLVDYYSSEELQDAIDTIVSQPSLPSNLDEAANEKVDELLADMKINGDMIYLPTARVLMIALARFGAEWMAGQGFISEGIINQTSGEDTIIELNEHIGYLEDCEEVIVNVRKKQ